MTTVEKITALAELGYTLEISTGYYGRKVYFCTVSVDSIYGKTQYSNRDFDALIDQVHKSHTKPTWDAQELLNPNIPKYDPLKDDSVTPQPKKNFFRRG